MAQVSMNLTDFEQTPIHRVFEFVKREAARYGCVPVSSEIVGLIPKLALEQAAEWFLQVENFDSSLILENRLAAVMSGKAGRRRPARRSRAFHRTTGRSHSNSRRRQRGGGCWRHGRRTCRHGCDHVARQKSLPAIRKPVSEAIARLTPLREELKAAIDADAESYNVVMKAYKAAKESADGGRRAINAALRQAASVPLGVAERAVEVARIAAALKPITNPNMHSDLITAIALARAALEGALANVEINLDSIKPGSPEDEAFVAETRKRAAELRA